MNCRLRWRRHLTPPDPPDPDEPIEVASPVCYAPELEPPSPAPFQAGEAVTCLNALLENERAVLRVLRNWSLEAGHNADVGAWTLAAIRDDITGICARLWDDLSARGAEPSSAVGAFYDGAMALTTWPDRLRCLDLGLSCLARDVRAALARAGDQALIDLLRHALDRHEDAINQMTGIRDRVPGAPQSTLVP